MSLVRFEKTKNGFPCAVNPHHVISVTFDGQHSNVHLASGSYVTIRESVDGVISRLQTAIFQEQMSQSPKRDA